MFVLTTSKLSQNKYINPCVHFLWVSSVLNGSLKSSKCLNAKEISTAEKECFRTISSLFYYKAINRIPRTKWKLIAGKWLVLGLE